MDNTLETTEEKVHKCIILTNKTIHRWYTLNGVKPSRVYFENVQAIFFGHLKKYVFYNENIDFKRARKLITLFLDENKYIHNITTIDSDQYWKNKYKVSEVFRVINGLGPDVFTKHLEESDELTNNIQLLTLNFDNIKQIKF